jgi:sugar/nucleoside kinase (ribokinase family)
VDAIILNDQEARQITGETNLIKAARGVSQLGPRMVIVKKGEHGAFLLADDTFFAVPAYPLEALFDPTGAGDSFAGGLFGYLASCGAYSQAAIRKAIVYGSVVASFAVEKFSVDRMRDLTKNEIEDRYRQFGEITRF